MNDVYSTAKIDLARFIKEEFGISLENFSESARLKEDLDFDSIDTLRLLFYVEETTKKEIPNEVTVDLLTIKDVIDYLAKVSPLTVKKERDKNE